MATITVADDTSFNLSDLYVAHLLTARSYIDAPGTFTAHYLVPGNSDIFHGTDLTYSGNGLPDGGTITSFREVRGGDTTITIHGLNVAAADVTHAAETLSTTDDRALFNAALSGDDQITGGNLDDLLQGFDGNDTLSGRGGGDEERGGRGNDHIYGGAGNDLLLGNTGNDVLDGGTGHDVLSGDGGADTFVFHIAAGLKSDPHVTDFTHAQDHVELKLGGGITLPNTDGVLDDCAFHVGTHARDADDRIIYDPHSGAVYYDGDGCGHHGQVEIGTLQAHLHVSAADFLVA